MTIETKRQARKARHFRIIAGMILISAGLSGCIATTGDFGRPQAGIWENSALPLAGLFSAKLRGEPASFYALTEAEIELRNRSWRFLMPETDAPLLTREQDHKAFHRLLPPREPDPSLFHRTVMQGPHLGAGIGYSPILRTMTGPGSFRSLTSRYNRVRDTIAEDHMLVPAFRQVAAQVVEADRVRARGLEHIPNLTAEQRDEATARICENALIIARVSWAFVDRAAMYRYSLEHLLVEGPEREAIQSERSLMAFERDIGAFQNAVPLPPGCLGTAPLPPVMQPGPLVRKG